MMNYIKILFIGILILSWGGLASSIEGELAKLYKDCLLPKERIFLTKEQKENIEKLSGVKLYSMLKIRYKNKCNNSSIYIDSHIVRTLNQTLLLEVKNQSIHKMKTLHFMEPLEYKSPIKWLKSFYTHKLNDKLKLNVDIDGLSGATLTATAVTNAGRKILAIEQVLNEK
ncbi:FMN-binding protein [Bacteriovoracaceae bacterium]|nr:FMN-binding protein [Bacteriovoracaceae bacterium]